MRSIEVDKDKGGTATGIASRLRQWIVTALRAILSWITVFILYNPDVGKNDERESSDKNSINIKINILADEAPSTRDRRQRCTHCEEQDNCASEENQTRTNVQESFHQKKAAQSDIHANEQIPSPQHESQRPLVKDHRTVDNLNVRPTTSQSPSTSTRRHLRDNRSTKVTAPKQWPHCPHERTAQSRPPKTFETSLPSISEVTVQVEGTMFSLNRYPLQEQSNIFRKLSRTNDQATSKIKITGIGVDAFCHILRWIYSHEVHLTEINVLSVLDVAIKLEIEDLVRECQKFIQKSTANELLWRDMKGQNATKHGDIREPMKKKTEAEMSLPLNIGEEGRGSKREEIFKINRK